MVGGFPAGRLPAVLGPRCRCFAIEPALRLSRPIRASILDDSRSRRCALRFPGSRRALHAVEASSCRLSRQQLRSPAAVSPCSTRHSAIRGACGAAVRAFAHQVAIDDASLVSPSSRFVR
jgi:hypothetical protein